MNDTFRIAKCLSAFRYEFTVSSWPIFQCKFPIFHMRSKSVQNHHVLITTCMYNTALHGTGLVNVASLHLLCKFNDPQSFGLCVDINYCMYLQKDRTLHYYSMMLCYMYLKKHLHFCSSSVRMLYFDNLIYNVKEIFSCKMSCF